MYRWMDGYALQVDGRGRVTKPRNEGRGDEAEAEAEEEEEVVVGRSGRGVCVREGAESSHFE